MISTVIGIIVAYVPEGLPLSLALTLTFIARHMKKLNVLVKKLSTVETLGSVNVIASDKTGTLTQNRMSVSDIFAGMRSVTVKSCVQLLENNDESFLESIRVLSLCNRAEYRVEQVRGEMSPDGAADQRRVIVGDASDTAFLTFCQDLQNISSMRSRYPKLAEIPFNSKNKYMLTIVREDANHVTLLMKGAAEQILARCTSYITSTGLEVPITDEDRSAIEREIEYFGRQGKRVLAGARLKLDPTIWSPTFEFNTEVVNFPMDGLCFVCLGCLIDPPRPDVPAAMDTLKTAGVRVLMVTGDHPTTAVAIAKIVGIISATAEIVRFSQATPLEPVNIGKNALCVLGQDVPTISKDQWDIIVKQYKEVVFARTTPEQKLTIVKEYQRCGCIVAATGDGTNDAPALKQANVGVAMGCGTDIAREAADIILIDNRFSSITIGIKYGRLAFDNLRKIVTYVLPSGNWAEMIPIALSAFMGIPLPLSAFLMIFICCATDVGPAMSLVTELPEGDIMHRKPRVESKERLIDIGLFLRAFAFLGSIECTAALVSFFLYFYWYAKITPYQLFFLFDNWADGFHGYTMNELNEFLYTAQTVYFVAIIGCQIGQLMTTRLSRLNFYQQWFWTNPVLLIGILIELLLAVLIIYLPLFNTLFKTRQPPVEFWFIPLAFGVVVFVLSEVLKVLRRISFAIFKHIKANIEAKKLQTIQAHEEINKL
jgi:sodium/potassium-transporting ATPase subunit alpha